MKMYRVRLCINASDEEEYEVHREILDTREDAEIYAKGWESMTPMREINGVMVGHVHSNFAEIEEIEF